MQLQVLVGQEKENMSANTVIIQKSQPILFQEFKLPLLVQVEAVEDHHTVGDHQVEGDHQVDGNVGIIFELNRLN